MKLEDDHWFSGGGQKYSHSDILSFIELHTSKQGEIFIGTDSMLDKRSCTFVTAICLHGADDQIGGRYFFTRTKGKSEPYRNLKVRILQEVFSSITIGQQVKEIFPGANIEIHIDVGTTVRSQTRHLADIVTGWTKAAGFICRIKPYSWASTAVADKHTK